MKTKHLFLILSAVSLTTKTTIDYIIGTEAEFLNAYSVIQRLINLQQTTGDSFIARELGAIGEFAVVLVANFLIGGLLTLFTHYFKRS